jgi:hypothetical protein
MSTYNYDVNGKFLNATQFQRVIAPAVQAQKAAFVAAAAAATKLDPSEVDHAVEPAQNADGTTKVNGDNVQFNVTSSDVLDVLNPVLAAGTNNRTPGEPSIHLHTDSGYYHLDTISPYSSFPLGLLEHFGVDVLGGTLFYGPVPIPRR